eukprot:5114659-Amphidinium_carterae.1
MQVADSCTGPMVWPALDHKNSTRSSRIMEREQQQSQGSAASAALKPLTSIDESLSSRVDALGGIPGGRQLLVVLA